MRNFSTNLEEDLRRQPIGGIGQVCQTLPGANLLRECCSQGHGTYRWNHVFRVGFVEVLNQVPSHQNVAMLQLEQLIKHHQGLGTGETTQVPMTSVLGTLKCLYIDNDQDKSMFDDYGEKGRILLPVQIVRSIPMVKPAFTSVITGTQSCDRAQDRLVRGKHCQVRHPS